MVVSVVLEGLEGDTDAVLRSVVESVVDRPVGINVMLAASVERLAGEIVLRDAVVRAAAVGDGVTVVVFANGDTPVGICEPLVKVTKITVVDVEVVVETDAVVESTFDAVVEVLEVAEELAVELDTLAGRLTDELVEVAAADSVEEVVEVTVELVSVVDGLAASVVDELAEGTADGNADIGVTKVELEVDVDVCTTG